MIKKLIERRAMTAAIVRAVRSRTLECLIIMLVSCRSKLY